MSERDADYLDRAIQLACESVGAGGGPFGAVVVRDGSVVAEGQNQVTRILDPTAHAEVVALRLACKRLGDFRLDGCTIYASAEPCPMCLAAVYWSRTSRVVFAASRHDAADAEFDDAMIYEELSKPLAARTIETLQLSVPRAQEPFQLWSTAATKIQY